MSRTARLHDTETRRESDAGTPLLPRSVLRVASGMGTGTRATLLPVAHKGGMYGRGKTAALTRKPPTGARYVGPIGIAPFNFENRNKNHNRKDKTEMTEAKEITATFNVAMSTINQHIALAASSRGTGRAALEYVHFEVEGDRVHIVSTDGRVMLHTDARSAGGIAERTIAFDVRAMPKANAKKAMMGAESDVIFTVKDGVIFSGDIVARVTTGINYPTWRDAVPVCSRLERETSWRAINPKYCALALKFVGEGGYARPYRVKDMTNGPVVFLSTSSATDELNTAVVMPIRTEGAE